MIYCMYFIIHYSHVTRAAPVLECTQCIISDRSHKKSQPPQAADAHDCLHGYEELVAAIIDAHHGSLSKEEIDKVIDVVCLSPEPPVYFTLF